jgi:hypothetical protein
MFYAVSDSYRDYKKVYIAYSIITIIVAIASFIRDGIGYALFNLFSIPFFALLFALIINAIYSAFNNQREMSSKLFIICLSISFIPRALFALAMFIGFI